MHMFNALQHPCFGAQQAGRERNKSSGNFLRNATRSFSAKFAREMGFIRHYHS